MKQHANVMNVCKRLVCRENLKLKLRRVKLTSVSKRHKEVRFLFQSSELSIQLHPSPESIQYYHRQIHENN